jgi:hypothetical protein
MEQSGHLHASDIWKLITTQIKDHDKYSETSGNSFPKFKHVVLTLTQWRSLKSGVPGHRLTLLTGYSWAAYVVAMTFLLLTQVNLHNK